MRLIIEFERATGAEMVSLEVPDPAAAARRVLRRGLLLRGADGALLAVPAARVISARTLVDPGDDATDLDLEPDAKDEPAAPAAPAEAKPGILRRLFG